MFAVGCARDVRICAVNSTSWEELPLQGRPVREIAYIGNGKDADLVISFADGSRGTVGSHRVTINSAAPVRLTIESLDDLNVAVRVTGEGLAVGSGRLLNDFADDETFGAEIRDGVARWATPGRHEIGVAAPIELELTGLE